MPNDFSIEVEGLSKCYRIGSSVANQKGFRGKLSRLQLDPISYLRNRLRAPGEDEILWALNKVSFQIRKGEVVGVIGRNGAGKSTLLKILSRITEPTTGRAVISGRVNSLLEIGTGFHPELTGRENIYLSAAIHGMRKQEVDRKFDEIVSFGEIEKFLNTPVKRYSSGMYMRLAFAVAAHLEPEVLLIDEVLAVGDYAFQRKCLGKMEDVAQQGRTILIVSHNMASILNLCRRSIFLDRGALVMDGPTSEVIQTYLAANTNASGSVEWSDPATAPGTDKVRFHSVAVMHEGEKSSGDLDIQKDILVRMRWWNLKDGSKLYSALHVLDQHGTTIWCTGNLPSACFSPDPLWNQPHSVGLYESVCRIPANFLNDAMYSISVFVGTNVQHVEVHLERVLSFRIFDSGGMRREYQGSWAGAVRIRTDWHTHQLEPTVRSRGKE